MENADEINAKIHKWKSLFKEYIQRCTNEGIVPDRDYFISLLDMRDPKLPETPQDITSFVYIARQFVKSIKKTHGQKTQQAYETLIENVVGFDKKQIIPTKPDAINQDWYRRFGIYLVEEENNYNNTINRKIGRIITILNWAVPQYTRAIDYKKRYNFKPSQAARFAIWPDEFEIIKKIKPRNENHRRILAAFCFACETTLRYSDVDQLYPHHLQMIPDGKKEIPVLDLTQIKTVNQNDLPLTQYALTLWKSCVTDHKTPVFNLGYSQKANDVLKEYFEHAKLNRACEIARTQGNKVHREILPLYDVISFHMSRNTAITSQLSSLPHALVMENAGIKKVDTLMGYMRDDKINRYRQTLKALNKKKA